MEDLQIRKYSSPFSYMVCDLETSLRFIETNFIYFTKVVSKQIHDFKWNGRPWYHHLFFNFLFVPPKNNIDVSELKRVCVWNHHKLNDPTVLESVDRRCGRLLHALNSGKPTLLIYIDNIHPFTTKNWGDYIRQERVMNFLAARPSCHMFLCVPILEFPADPTIQTVSDQLSVILYNSNKEGNINDYKQANIRWDVIKNFTLTKYKFELVPIAET